MSLFSPFPLKNSSFYSSKLRFTRSSRAVKASSSSLPSAVTSSCEPCPAASIIKPIILLPSISSSSFSTSISQSKRLAIFTNCAAGRAWIPSLLLTVNVFEHAMRQAETNRGGQNGEGIFSSKCFSCLDTPLPMTSLPPLSPPKATPANWHYTLSNRLP